ncbi:hypothetical protein ACFQDN_22250 [Pseudomonas asuensis]|uniref:Uncharacterized protein n=1 Tax=Pseudomonas asuensis TaxID=1825787 RepID=A0ABQ2H1F1_9PSED|nr:hypothetical protein [Pseudomonas asuensis]GGM25965.1 hypothetical protein GCM10009425_40900 [Pseudomonas asuensis]
MTKKMSLLALIEACEENNQMYDSQWSQWQRLDDIIYAYGHDEGGPGTWEQNYDDVNGTVPVEEAQDILQRAIDTNGQTIQIDSQRIYNRLNNVPEFYNITIDQLELYLKATL